MPGTRCVNLDWLEVHALEPPQQPRDAVFFRSLGIEVVERAYGTRVYREMFTIKMRGHDFLEVRRNPYSQGYQGLFAAEECHLRLVNSACYLDNAVQLLQQFMSTYGYQFNRISRADICLDFETFDKGDDPARFVARYFKHVYAKINQGNIRAHGSDSWSGQSWNSLSWGSLTSDIGTKLYNKTLELYDPHTDSFKKPYIRYAWQQCGLVDDFHSCTKQRPDGTSYRPQIWRVEFSIRSSVKKWFAIELDGKRKAYQSIRNTLDMYDSRPKLLTLFASLANHYFRFKYVEYKRPRRSSIVSDALSAVQLDASHPLISKDDRQLQRKDRCRDKILFDFSGQQITYKVAREQIPQLLGDRVTEKPLNTLIAKLRNYAQTHPAPDIHDACQVIIRSIQGDALRSELNCPWSYQDLIALQQALAQKVEGNASDVAVLMREIKNLLNINDNTAIF